MRASDSISVPAPLRRAAERFGCWRNKHELGRRIPNRLWELAVELAATYGVSRTASALGLDYYSLKRHLSDSVAPAVPALGPSAPAAFVELPPSAFSAGEYLIDLENSRGAKMRIQWKGTAPDLVALSRGFWSVD